MSIFLVLEFQQNESYLWIAKPDVAYSYLTIHHFNHWICLCYKWTQSENYRRMKISYLAVTSYESIVLTIHELCSVFLINASFESHICGNRSNRILLTLCKIFYQAILFQELVPAVVEIESFWRVMLPMQYNVEFLEMGWRPEDSGRDTMKTLDYIVSILFKPQRPCVWLVDDDEVILGSTLLK